MNLNDRQWGNFILSSIFDIKKGKRLKSADQIPGKNHYIGAIDSNNGVANYIEQSPLHPGNTISLSYNGSVGEAYYQAEPYWATDDVNVLYFKESNGVEFNKFIGLFICTVLRQDKYRWSYGRKWKLEAMRKSIISLPKDKNEKPDWQFMEDYIKTLHYKPLTTQNKADNVPKLNIEGWKDFFVKDIFPYKRVKHYSAIPEEDGQYEFVSSTTNDNGVSKHVDAQSVNGNCITVSTNGECFSCFYHELPIVVSSDVEVLYSSKINKYSALFICSVLEKEKYRWNYGRKPKSGKVRETVIKLPVTTAGEPDWQWMEDYIKTLPYGDRI